MHPSQCLSAELINGPRSRTFFIVEGAPRKITASGLTTPTQHCYSPRTRMQKGKDMDTNAVLSAALCFLALLYGADSQTPVPARPLGKPQAKVSKKYLLCTSYPFYLQGTTTWLVRTLKWYLKSFMTSEIIVFSCYLLACLLSHELSIKSWWGLHAIIPWPSKIYNVAVFCCLQDFLQC